LIFQNKDLQDKHEVGYDIRMIQELLGHKSSKKTEIYTHVSTKSIKNVYPVRKNLSLNPILSKKITRRTYHTYKK